MFFLQDWLGLVTVSGLVLGTFGMGEVLRHRAHWASEHTRKFAHIGCGVIVFFFPYLFESVHTVGVLAAAFLLLLISTKLLGFMQSVHAVRRNTGGVFYYPVAIYLTGVLTWDRPAVFQICVLLLALADGLAALVGKHWGRNRYHLGAHVRTLEGSGTVLAVSWVATVMLLTSSGIATFHQAAAIGTVLAAIICAVEALSLWGIDNLLIPLVAAVFLNSALAWGRPMLMWQVGACFIAAAIAWACHLRGYLKLNGAVAAWLVGYLTLGMGGMSWFVPLLAFFLAVSVLGKLAHRLAGHRLPRGFEHLEEKGARRDFVQVAANAGVGVGLVIAYAALAGRAPALSATLFWAYLGSLCAASADTFASEIGVYSRQRPVLLWTFRPVPPGLSGGVTWLGYAGAALGALVPGVTLALVRPGYGLGARELLAALACGLIGSTVDSVVGATLQGKRSCEACAKVMEKAEHCGYPTRHVSGLRWMTNDAVNAIGALAGALAGAVLFKGGV